MSTKPSQPISAILFLHYTRSRGRYARRIRTTCSLRGTRTTNARRPKDLYQAIGHGCPSKPRSVVGWHEHGPRVVVLVDQSTARGYGCAGQVLGISALLQIWRIGALAWLASFRSLLIATPGLVFVVVMTLVLIFASLQPTMSFELPLAGFLASLGLLLAYVAYRRWLKADFD